MMKFSLAALAILSVFPSLMAAPLNDNCHDAIPIGYGTTVTGSTEGAENDTPSAGLCGASGKTPSLGVWYKFNSFCGGSTVFQAGITGLSTCDPGTNYDSAISLYMGDCDNLVCVGGNDDAGDDACDHIDEYLSILEVDTLPNTEYFVLLHGYFGETGQYMLSLDHSSGGACGGDPHVLTWSGDWYDFHGECDLVFLNVPDFDNCLGLVIHIRTKKRYEYSFIESAVLRIGEDILEMSGWGQYMLNGISEFETPVLLADKYPIALTHLSEKETKLDIQLSERESITLSSFKDMVHVEVSNGSFTNFQNSTGLMGDYLTGKLLGRDGVTVFDDHNGFGNEWQVLANEPKLFMEHERSPQHPQKCNMPDATAAMGRRRRLGEASIAREDAEGACGHHKGDQFDLCVYDVLATGDIEVAKAGWL